MARKTPPKEKPARREGATRGPLSPAPSLTVRTQVRHSPEEHETWTAEARSLGLELGTWMRMACNLAMRRK